VNGATGTATPIAEFAVMYGFNDPLTVTLIAGLCAGCGLLWGFIGSYLFKNFNIRRVGELAETDTETETSNRENPTAEQQAI